MPARSPSLGWSVTILTNRGWQGDAMQVLSLITEKTEQLPPWSLGALSYREKSPATVLETPCRGPRPRRRVASPPAFQAYGRLPPDVHALERL